MELKSLILFMY